MLTLFLALTAPADAADAKLVITPPRGGYDYDTCMKAADTPTGAAWWGTVAFNISMGYGPDYRSSGSCFDVNAVSADSDAQEKLASVAEGIAYDEDAKFSRPSTTGERVVLTSETSEPCGEKYNYMPVGPGLIGIFAPDGSPLATFDTMGVGGVENMGMGDYNNNGMNDYIFITESGMILEAMDVPMGDMITFMGQQVFYNY